ncbi:hypothetical protein J2W54_002798 [Rhodococcus fascians]|uniref:hypothetical protein n=1 Tax=Nocardiaceae TaxID=85025 RepID=UPI002863ECF8|nr:MULTISPECIES: hypothetical protein [Rhodococcus]MDR6910845.1 hypothetical protein [Rhodococcus sp. 3258]MDR6932404.1 hypothetical protein [Rhodococcus fascians]
MSFDPVDYVGESAESIHTWRTPSWKQRVVGRVATRALSIITVVLMTFGLVALLPFGTNSRAVIQYESRLHYEVAAWLISGSMVALLLRILIGLRAARRYRKRISLSLPTVVRSCPDAITRVRETVEAAFNRFNDVELASAALHLTQPSVASPRVGHRILLSGKYDEHELIRRVDQIRQADSYEQLVVVHRVRKSALLSDFQIKIDGKEWTTLSQRDSSLVLVGALTALYDRFESKTVDEERFTSLLTAVLADHPVEESSSEVSDGEAADFGSVSTLERYLATLELSLLNQNSERGLEVHNFISNLRELSKYYIIWTGIPVPAVDGQVSTSSPAWNRVWYRYVVRSRPKTKDWSELVRVAIGLFPRKLRYLAPVALEARSYHLDLVVPEGFYLYESGLEFIETSPLSWSNAESLRRLQMIQKAVADRLSMRDRFAYVLHRRRGYERKLAMGPPSARGFFKLSGVGSMHAHAYLRNISRVYSTNSHGRYPSGIVPAVRFELREQPPGFLLPVMLISAYTAALVWVVGALYTSVFMPGLAIPTVWATVLFGIPAIVSAWVITKFSASAIGKVSLAVFVVSMWTIANSILAVAISAITASRPKPWAWGGEPIKFYTSGPSIDFIDLKNELNVLDVLWYLLLLSTVANLGVILLMLITRYCRYMLRSRS